MNTAIVNSVIGALEQEGLAALGAAIPVLVKVATITNPGSTEAQIVAIVEGQIKHQGREKVGILIDILWPFVEPAVAQAAAEAYAQSEAQTPATPSVAPAAPQVGGSPQ